MAQLEKGSREGWLTAGGCGAGLRAGGTGGWVGWGGRAGATGGGKWTPPSCGLIAMKVDLPHSEV